MRRYLMQYTHKIDNKHASYIDNIDIKKKIYFIVLEGKGGGLRGLILADGIGNTYNLLFKIR